MLLVVSGTWASKLKLNEFTFKGITNMSCLKKYAYAPFISLLYGVSATASPDLMYDIDKRDYSVSTEVTPQFSWDKSESQGDKTQYCLTPRDPGCSKMWHEEKAKDYSWSTEVTPKLSGRKVSLKMIKLTIVLPLAIQDAAICGIRKKRRSMTSGGSVPNKKGFIINISDRSKAHIQFSIVGYYAWLVTFLIVRLIIFDDSFLENFLQLI